MPSQHQEDAVLRRIFSLIGTTNKFCVEFGARGGVSCSNTHRLRTEDGWTGVLLDSHPRGSDVRKAHLTAENINQVFADAGVPPVFDLLSIDVDGNDLHLWKALDGFTPRVVIIEYNSMFPPDHSVTVPYEPARRWDHTNYYGASAAALVKLGTEKGYTLVDAVAKANLVFVRTEALASLAAIPPPPADPYGYPAPREPRQWEVY